MAKITSAATKPINTAKTALMAKGCSSPAIMKINTNVTNVSYNNNEENYAAFHIVI